MSLLILQFPQHINDHYHEVVLSVDRNYRLSPVFFNMFLKLMNVNNFYWKSCRKWFDNGGDTDQILILQCDSGDQNEKLIACARHIIHAEQQYDPQAMENPTHLKHVILIVKLPRVKGGCFNGFEVKNPLTCYNVLGCVAPHYGPVAESLKRSNKQIINLGTPSSCSYEGEKLTNIGGLSG